jgi:hypothetical protein
VHNARRRSAALAAPAFAARIIATTAVVGANPAGDRHSRPPGTDGAPSCLWNNHASSALSANSAFFLSRRVEMPRRADVPRRGILHSHDTSRKLTAIEQARPRTSRQRGGALLLPLNRFCL